MNLYRFITDPKTNSTIKYKITVFADTEKEAKQYASKIIEVYPSLEEKKDLGAFFQAIVEERKIHSDISKACFKANPPELENMEMDMLSGDDIHKDYHGRRGSEDAVQFTVFKRVTDQSQHFKRTNCNYKPYDELVVAKNALIGNMSANSPPVFHA